MDWIPVTELMPLPRTRILVSGCGYVVIAEFIICIDNLSAFWATDADAVWQITDDDGWMPLPPPADFNLLR